MIAYPGRTFGQLYHRMIRGNELATGTVHFEGRDISFADITVPVLSFGGANDTIAPVSCVRPIENLVPNAPEMRFEIVPGGHLGMLTGRAARRTTWRIMDEFLARTARPPAARRRREPPAARGQPEAALQLVGVPQPGRHPRAGA